MKEKKKLIFHFIFTKIDDPSKCNSCVNGKYLFGVAPSSCVTASNCPLGNVGDGAVTPASCSLTCSNSN